MFSHITLGVNNLEKSVVLYDGIMSVLGYVRHSTGDSYAGYGDANDGHLGVDSLWINRPIDGNPATNGNGTNIALRVSERSIVDDFYEKALELGAKDEGKPGIREEAHPNFYAAYVCDFDGNKLVVVCHE